MNDQIDGFYDAGAGAGTAVPDRDWAHHADGDDGHDCECEFCSPEPEIMPLPRSGAARTSVQQPIDEADDAIGELLT